VRRERKLTKEPHGNMLVSRTAAVLGGGGE